MVLNSQKLQNPCGFGGFGFRGLCPLVVSTKERGPTNQKASKLHSVFKCLDVPSVVFSSEPKLLHPAFSSPPPKPTRTAWLAAASVSKRAGTPIWTLADTFATPGAATWRALHPLTPPAPSCSPATLRASAEPFLEAQKLWRRQTLERPPAPQEAASGKHHANCPPSQKQSLTISASPSARDSLDRAGSLMQPSRLV